MQRVPRTWRLLGLGPYIAFCLVAGIGGGVWLDQQLGSAPLFLLVGLLLSFVVVGFGTYQMLKEATE